jgi:hypothetical protein
MKFKTILAAVAFLAAGSASAAVLTFDGLTDMMYGDGFPLADGMTYDGTNLTYQEAGFQLTLNAPNADAGAAHVGDGTFVSQTFNWRDGVGDNGTGTFMTLTRVGGGKFNLNSFDYYVYDPDTSDVSADGISVGAIQGEGTWTSGLSGITELRLTPDAFGFAQVDNIDVTAAADTPSGSVPLPGTLALMLGGLAAGGLARRRRG